jgi:hypothetical protein
MKGATVNFGSLPRASTLTGVLLAPNTDLLDADELSSVRTILQRDVQSVMRRIDRAEPLRVDPYRVRKTASGEADGERPFEWNPWTARRSLGLEAVRACLGRPRLTPLEATRAAVDRLIRRTSEDTGAGSLAGWLASLRLGARAVVEAEATLWATQLLSAVQWTEPATRLVGFDRSVVLFEAPRVILRGRVDLELRPAVMGEGAPTVPTGGLLVVMTGHPLPSARLELAVSALAAALSNRSGVTPARIVGLWPQCGRALDLPIDVDLLLRGCSAVVDTIRADVERSPRRLPERQREHAHQLVAEKAAS